MPRTMGNFNMALQTSSQPQGACGAGWVNTESAGLQFVRRSQQLRVELVELGRYTEIFSDLRAARW
jgi:hypothetical protein